ncbi:uncharacterized protein LOC131429968 [Malaya genurostris]|uniref:uncharacterized protein LOC131429968 n=1 Tax=Malaya genurostris TaxID=325434 RepID=UPI0026F392F1|nr:uncharacterized protein LOC131429968 [Malaya genurostris]
MHLVTLLEFQCLIAAGFAIPFTDWKLGGQTNFGGGILLNKLQDIGEKVYDRKREFLNGINEKVSNLLWIPPLKTTTEAPTATPVDLYPALYPYPPVQENDQLIFTSDDKDDYTPNLVIYARSSFLSPDDLIEVSTPTARETRVNVINNFSLIRKSLS